MDDAHKAKLAQGRADARAVKSYLEYLEENKPKRGRRRTKESIAKRLEAIASDLENASPLARLNLVQERMDLETERAAMDDVVDGSALRDAFIEAAPRYAAAKGISGSAFKTLGVDAKTLQQAGISSR